MKITKPVNSIGGSKLFYQIIVFVLLTAADFNCRQLLKFPKLSMKKNIKNLQTEREKTGQEAF
jgi:hypothetical protein